MKNRFTEMARVEVPLLCGPMYPCSNPELVAAVSEAGGLGVIQPLSLVYVHGLGFREGLRRIRSLTQKPVGLNILTEKSLSAVYRKRMEEYFEASLEAGIRFFITALGNPDWVVKRAHAAGAVVFHDVVDRKWAEKGLAEGVDGLICVNSRAGGHAGRKTPRELLAELSDLGVPLVCAGGVGSEAEFRAMLDLGYEAVQMGTRFIASEECSAHPDYKQAILDATEEDVVLTERITGVPLSIIRTPYVEKMGTKAGPIGRWMLSGHRTKHWMRAISSVRSAFQLKSASMKGASSQDFWQAGKRVATIRAVEPAGAIVR
ncbi:MAG TPA: nitronate monooxygenase, partial [Thermoanaerobaculia bacterium]|nr:nitronate monooxygenase [Thermoanaerobaculia bacterium]